MTSHTSHMKVIALGALVHLPLPLLLVLPSNPSSIHLSLGEWAFVPIALASWVFCLAHAASNLRIAGSGKKAPWIIALILLSLLATIAYFWLQIWPYRQRPEEPEA